METSELLAPKGSFYKVDKESTWPQGTIWAAKVGGGEKG